MNPPKALSPKDVVKYYPAMGSEGHLANLRCQGRGPKYYRVGRKIIYKPEDVEAFLFSSPVLTQDSLEPAK